MWWSDLAGRLEGAKRLDPAVEAVTDVVNRVLPEGPVKDVWHGRWLGHPLHPVLVGLPIGMFSSASLLDMTGGARDAARRLVGAGVVLVAPTAAAGWADWSSLGAFERPKRVGLVHAGANVAAVVLQAASWNARRTGDHTRGRLLSAAGMAMITAGGFLGGHLAYSQGVGVNRNADRSAQPEDWTDAIGTGEVAEGELRRVEVAGQPVLLSRQGGQLGAIGAVCTHYGGPLEDGELVGSCVQCPWHGSRFDLEDGSVSRGPATVPQPAYDLRVVEDRVQIRARP